MCGRYTMTQTDPAVVSAAFDIEMISENLSARYNIAPSQQIATVVENRAGDNHIYWMRWGLIPAWAKDASIGNRMINARSETLSSKPSFREAYRRRRCLIIADGFYEWQKNKEGFKTPMYVRLKKGGLFGMAGLWERWTDPHTGEIITSCTIITTTPNEVVRPLHHRMAAIIPPDAYKLWLSPKQQDVKKLQSLLQPYPAEAMEAYAVSTQVNDPRNDGPELTRRVS